jgi:hypothetical protein
MAPKRALTVAVDSQCSPTGQPPTFGGLKSDCPMPSSSQTQESTVIGVPVARSAPTRNTTGDLTMSGSSRFAYSAAGPQDGADDRAQLAARAR